MKIIGVGCGPGLLTEQAIKELRKAWNVYGSGRAIELARPYLAPQASVKSIDDFKALHKLPADAVVLSTGDPMLAGLGYLTGEVIPGISSCQLALSRLHIPQSRVAIVVAHGRGHEKGMQETLEEVQRGKIVFLLADPKFDLPELYRRLAGHGMPLQVSLCENLGYKDEKIITAPIQSPPVKTADLYSVVIGNF
jgi:cobalt-precorrin-7 (C5)-methyltransferase